MAWPLVSIRLSSCIRQNLERMNVREIFLLNFHVLGLVSPEICVVFPGLLIMVNFQNSFSTKPSLCLFLRKLMVQMYVSLVCMYRNMDQSVSFQIQGEPLSLV